MSNNNGPVDVPLTVIAVGDEVTVSGEWGVGLSMTPAAATASGEALIAAAREALRNREAGLKPG